jgi:hypothetical protein
VSQSKEQNKNEKNLRSDDEELVYHVLREITKAEIYAYEMFKRNMAIKRGRIGAAPIGAILTPNESVFGKVFNDTKGRRKKRDCIAELGKGFEHLYCIPETPDGKQLMRMIMLTDMEEYEREFYAAAVESGYYKPTDHFSDHARVLPLTYQENDFLCMGTDIDIIRMNRVKKILNANPDIHAGFICFDWQVKYYRRAMPNAIIMTVENVD